MPSSMRGKMACCALVPRSLRDHATDQEMPHHHANAMQDMDGWRACSAFGRRHVNSTPAT
jgi:hypothetical protein